MFHYRSINGQNGMRHEQMVCVQMGARDGDSSACLNSLTLKRQHTVCRIYAYICIADWQTDTYKNTIEHAGVRASALVCDLAITSQ